MFQEYEVSNLCVSYMDYSVSNQGSQLYTSGSEAWRGIVEGLDVDGMAAVSCDAMGAGG